MSISTNAASLAQFEQQKRLASLNGGVNPITPTTRPAPTVTAATAQAADGAAQAQPKAEPFNAPMLKLPPDPTSQDVRNGLVRAMADPSVNSSTAAQLFDLYTRLMEAEKAMNQIIIDAILG